MIVDSLQVYDVEPGKWLMAACISGVEDFDWVWLWHVEPVGTNQTRLLVRSDMRLPAEASNPVVSTVVDLGGFVMERRMIEGLKLRAEGGTEPAEIEAVEILLWMAALAAGLGACHAGLLLTRPAWQVPLLLGLAVLFTLIWFTFWQPSIWLRLLFDIALFALLWWVASPGATGYRGYLVGAEADARIKGGARSLVGERGRIMHKSYRSTVWVLASYWNLLGF
jgi:hypothetical protein